MIQYYWLMFGKSPNDHLQSRVQEKPVLIIRKRLIKVTSARKMIKMEKRVSVKQLAKQKQTEHV